VPRARRRQLVSRVAADADRGLGPRNQEGPWKAARPYDTGATDARVIARSRAAGSGQTLDAALSALVIGAEIREPLATAHPVSAKATKR
jgi:hypothetical protein